MFGYFDETAEEVVIGLHSAHAGSNAGDIALMRAIVRCDLKRVHRRDDSFDLPHWVAIQLGISRWKASRWLKAGQMLDELPVLRDAYEQGELSTDKFVELARFADRGTEAGLLAWAKRTSAAGIRARADQELRALLPRRRVKPTNGVRSAGNGTRATPGCRSGARYLQIRAQGSSPQWNARPARWWQRPKTIRTTT